jgi:hypothetical protein
MFAWRGWSNPIFGIRGSAVTSCFRTALNFEGINGSSCERYSCDLAVVNVYLKVSRVVLNDFNISTEYLV